MEKFQNLIKECILKNYSKVFLEENYKATVFDIHANVVENNEVQDIFSKKDIEEFLLLFLNEEIETSDSKKLIDWEIPNFGTIKILVTTTEEKLYLSIYLPIGYDLFISEVSGINENILNVNNSSSNSSIPDLTANAAKKKILESSFVSISKDFRSENIKSSTSFRKEDLPPIPIPVPIPTDIKSSSNSNNIIPPPIDINKISTDIPTKEPVVSEDTPVCENKDIFLESPENIFMNTKTLKLFDETDDSNVCYVRLNDITRFKIKSNLKKLGTFVNETEFNNIKTLFKNDEDIVIKKEERYSNYYHCYSLSCNELIIKKFISDDFFQKQENDQLHTLINNKSGLIISLDNGEEISSADFITNYINCNFEKYILKFESTKKVQHINKKSIVKQQSIIQTTETENINSLINNVEPDVIILNTAFLNKDNIERIIEFSNKSLVIVQTNYIDKSELISSLKLLLENISSIRPLLDRYLRGIIKLNNTKYDIEIYNG